MNMGLVRVNIHYNGKIPWLNIQGPRYDIGLSPSIYNLLKDDPRIQIHPTNNDPIMKAKKAAEAEALRATQPVVETVVDEVVVEDEVVIIEEEETLIEGELVPEFVEEEPVVDEEVRPEPVIETELSTTEEDLAIEEALRDYDEEEEDIVLYEEEIIEAEELANFVRYEEHELLEMTKAAMKSILNDERGFEPGNEFYGRYHDNHDVLIAKVLDSQ